MWRNTLVETDKFPDRMASGTTSPLPLIPPNWSIDRVYSVIKVLSTQQLVGQCGKGLNGPWRTVKPVNIQCYPGPFQEQCPPCSIHPLKLPVCQNRKTSKTVI